MNNVMYIILVLVAIFYSISALKVFANAGFDPNNKKAQIIFYRFVICSFVVAAIGIYICSIYMTNLLDQMGIRYIN